MLRKAFCVLFFVVCCLSLGSFAQVQGACGTTANQGKVACTLAHVYDSPGFPTGSLPIYQNGQQKEEFDFTLESSPLIPTLGTELTTLPLSAPGSGIIFQLDKASGLEVRYTQSLGPILAERGDTIGRHKLFVAFAYQYFKFSTEDGISTRSLHNVLQHELDSPPEPEDSDLATTNDAVDLKIHQFTAFATFGLTSRIDVSAVIPFLNVRLGDYSAVSLVNVAPGVFHSFSPTSIDLNQSFSKFAEGTGIGDILFRGKARVWSGEYTKLAVGADVRFPTGDELNFRGSGTYGVRPFAALSYSRSRFAPHANLGYVINGNSILAGDLVTNTKAHLPNELTYSLGTDVGITPRFTFAADWLGEHVFNGFNVRQSSCTETYPPATGIVATCTLQGNAGAPGAKTYGPYPLTAPYRSSYSMNDLSLGAKINPVRNLLISLNAIIKLDDPGLRSTVVPLASIGYTF